MTLNGMPYIRTLAAIDLPIVWYCG